MSEELGFQNSSISQCLKAETRLSRQPVYVPLSSFIFLPTSFSFSFNIPGNSSGQPSSCIPFESEWLPLVHEEYSWS